MKAAIELTPASSPFYFPQDVFVPLVGTGGLFPNIDPANIQTCDIATVQLAQSGISVGGIMLFGDPSHMKIVGNGINSYPASEVISVATQQNVSIAGFMARNADIYAWVTAAIN